MLVRSIISPFSNGEKKIGKDPDAGKYWRQEEMGTTEDEMVGWHHQFDGHEFEQALRVGDGQGSLACCSPWGHKESDMTERLNWTRSIWLIRLFKYFFFFFYHKFGLLMLSHICTERGMLKLPTMIICLSFKFFDNFIHIWNYENLIFLFNWFIIMKCFFVSLIIFLALNSDLFNSATAILAFFC